MATERMEKIDKRIKRLLAIPGVLNWARQNFPRKDDTTEALRKFANADIQISLGPIYSLCAKIAYREITYDQALEKALSYEGRFYREAGEEILPLFNDYLAQNQDVGLKDFRKIRAPFPIGKRPDGKVSSIPVMPTFVTIREGRLHPVFVLGWVDSALSWQQMRLVCAVIRRALLTQQDFLGCDAEVVTFPRFKGHKVRYQGGWRVSSFEDLSDDELKRQIITYNSALAQLIEELER